MSTGSVTGKAKLVMIFAVAIIILGSFVVALPLSSPENSSTKVRFKMYDSSGTIELSKVNNVYVVKTGELVYLQLTGLSDNSIMITGSTKKGETEMLIHYSNEGVSYEIKFINVQVRNGNTERVKWVVGDFNVDMQFDVNNPNDTPIFCGTFGAVLYGKISSTSPADISSAASSSQDFMGYCGTGSLPSSGNSSTIGRVSGAIFTTTPDGRIVNENVHYTSKKEVYLDGGPPPNAPASAAGLPEGNYVFQVTDPSGNVALSDDPAKCRIVHVSSGVIDDLVTPSTLGLMDTFQLGTTTIPCHVADPPTPPAGPGVTGLSGRHDTNVDVDHFSDKGAIVVQLMPFLDTPNPGGVYKAWMTPLGDYQNKGGQLDQIPKSRGELKVKGKIVGFNPDPGFGPPRDQIKTDNFKVIGVTIPPPAPILNVKKFHDLNANSIRDISEPEIGVNQCVLLSGTITDCSTGGGWPISITDPTSVTNQFFTPVSITSEPAGNYIVQEGSLAGWEQSVAIVDGVSKGITNPVTVTVLGTTGEEHNVIFGDFKRGQIKGIKFEDMNGNGVRDTGEPGVAGVTVTLTGTDGMGVSVTASTLTGSNGAFSFTNLKPGTYTVTETVPVGSIASTPTSSSPHTLISDQVLDLGSVFGNFVPAEVRGNKFIDLNANGMRDLGEGCPPAPDVNNMGCQGVTIKLDGTDGMGNAVHLITTTNANGDYSFTQLKPGSYAVTVSEPIGFLCSNIPCSYLLTLTSRSVSQGNDFGDFSLAEIKGIKFEDMNGNGVRDTGEPGVAGVTIKLSGTDGIGISVSASTVTGTNGEFSFMIKPGSYTVTEILPAGIASSTSISSGPHKLISDQVLDLGSVFGNFRPVDIHAHKFFDFNKNGIKDVNEESIAGIKICLTRNGIPVTQDAFGHLIAGVDANGCQFTDSDGFVWWMDLRPGNFLVSERLNESQVIGLSPTTLQQTTIVAVSGQAPVTVEFGNVGACNGLTPGYWKNWRNHYTEMQIAILLQGTIADVGDATADIAEMDAIFAQWDASNPADLTILKAMLLANQLTINLTQNPTLPNPSGGSIFGGCLLLGQETKGSLGDAIQAALAIIANINDGNPTNDPTRAQILAVKDILDAFANQRIG